MLNDKKFRTVKGFIESVLNQQTLNQQKVDRIEGLINSELLSYLQMAHVFIDENIFILEQPIYRFLKKVFIEIKKLSSQAHEIIDYVQRILNRGFQMEQLVLLACDCGLFDRDLKKLCKSLTRCERLEKLTLDLGRNYLSDEIIGCLKSVFSIETIRGLNIGLSRLVNKKQFEHERS